MMEENSTAQMIFAFILFALLIIGLTALVMGVMFSLMNR